MKKICIFLNLERCKGLQILSNLVDLEKSEKVRLLSKFLLNIRMTRRRDHRRLTSDGPNGRNKVLRRLVWDCWCAAMSPDH